ncbi:OLC1v1036618C1 [Oldenlandia corymbosa var. corymbosa]|uniref:OLC1v1036618C1 n=1 Tax=Oldenlandia corymbosa var. corymbosa TaxID=529605 RepID=A0AAV1CVP5_OLDCO|nr:OLC1v1036618C1 [Oldenlandia corymbosa var. corymbosa]
MAHGLPRLSHEEQLKLGISGRVDMVIDTLKEVGLVAGWDCVTKTPALFRVDGMGAVMQGNILATGSGHTFAYSYLNLGQLIHQKDHPNEIKSNRVCRLDDVLEDPSQYKKYSNWSAWSVKEAARMAMKGIRYAAGHAAMASMLQISLVVLFVVASDRITCLYADVPVKKFLEKFSISVAKNREYYGGLICDDGF